MKKPFEQTWNGTTETPCAIGSAEDMDDRLKCRGVGAGGPESAAEARDDEQAEEEAQEPARPADEDLVRLYLRQMGGASCLRPPTSASLAHGWRTHGRNSWWLWPTCRPSRDPAEDGGGGPHRELECRRVPAAAGRHRADAQVWRQPLWTSSTRCTVR